LEQNYTANEAASRAISTRISYRTALHQHRTLSHFARISWVTWIVAFVTVAIWCFSAYQYALATGAHSLRDVLMSVLANAINIQNNDALANVLIADGAKYNDAILQGQYWRFVTPIFLHANLLHVGLNMLNFVVLGVFIERLVGHLRFLLIYIVTGVVSIIASFTFMPQEISVGASGAIFGLVGAYSIFVLVHRRAFNRGGIPALLWLLFIIGVNLSIGLFVPNVDNFAHVGGLLSGFLLGWWFTPLYRTAPNGTLVDTHSLSRRWPLALLTIIGTILLAIIALHFGGG
jgi:membrane associated rhomboid family serine protease